MGDRSQTFDRGGEHTGWIDGLVRYLARLNSIQLVSWISLVSIVCAMLATRSRTGMVAAGTAFVATALVRVRARRPGAVLMVMVIGLAGVLGLVSLLNLQEPVMRELRTLQDPAGALAGRLQHWRDSSVAVLDFPAFGGGLGAYRYITLPYQTHNTGFWFQHADNQYVEVLVEAGVVGIVAVFLLGIPALAGAFQIVRRSVAGGLEPVRETVALILFFVIVAQAVAAMADYGPILPSTSAFFVTLVALLAAVQADANPDRLLPPNRVVTAGMRIALIVGALSFTVDLVRAHECYLVLIDLERTVSRPLSWDSIQQQERIQERATQVLSGRPDDGRAHDAMSRLLRDSTRSKFLRGLPAFNDSERLEQAWPYTGCIALIRQIDSLKDDPAGQKHLHSVLKVRTQQSGMMEHCSQAVSRIPLPGPVIRRAARWAGAARIKDPGEQFALRARFNEPANGQLSLQLGELAMRSGDQERAENIWNQGLKLDESLRGLILDVYVSLGRLDEGLEVFGPGDYSQAVTALGASPGPLLRSRLMELADELWTDPQTAPAVAVQASRSRHLGYQDDVQERIRWLQRCVVWSPDEVQFRRDLAGLLFRSGRLRESMDAWYEVLKIDRFDQSAEREIARVQASLDAANRKGAGIE